jgi:hypothetical protein
MSQVRDRWNKPKEGESLVLPPPEPSEHALENKIKY